MSNTTTTPTGNSDAYLQPFGANNSSDDSSELYSINESLEVDEYDDDNYDGASDFSDLTSIKSGISNYIYENGRQYHSYRSKQYHMPVDEVEKDRLDMLQHIWGLLLRGKLYYAPTTPKKVLDLGTGTGIWCVEMGDYLPNSKIHGVDLVPIQPSWVPPNVIFELDDLEDEEGWTWKDNEFDYIHSREMLDSIRNWPVYIKNMYKHLEPGGYIELAEHDVDNFQSDDNSVGPALARFGPLLQQARAKIGFKCPTFEEIIGFVEDAGFEDIVYRRLKWPFGTWAKSKRHKELGALGFEQCQTGFEAYGLQLFTKYLGMSSDEVRKLCSDCIDELRDNKRVHIYLHVHLLYARKPLSPKVQVPKKAAV